MMRRVVLVVDERSRSGLESDFLDWKEENSRKEFLLLLQAVSSVVGNCGESLCTFAFYAWVQGRVHGHSFRPRGFHYVSVCNHIGHVLGQCLPLPLPLPLPR
jgi:hypothetical protein